MKHVKAGNNDITILKCTSAYPSPIEEANLIMMKQYADDFNVKVGLSDHTTGIVAPLAATVLGASVIEKHFIIDKSIGGPDAAFSLDENDFTIMVKSVREAEKSIGNVSYKLSNKQIKGKQFSRSLYVSEDIKKGEYFSHNNIRSVRPGYGMHPKYYHDIIGKKALKDIEMGTPVSAEMFKK